MSSWYRENLNYIFLSDVSRRSENENSNFLFPFLSLIMTLMTTSISTKTRIVQTSSLDVKLVRQYVSQLVCDMTFRLWILFWRTIEITCIRWSICYQERPRLCEGKYLRVSRVHRLRVRAAQYIICYTAGCRTQPFLDKYHNIDDEYRTWQNMKLDQSQLYILDKCNRIHSNNKPITIATLDLVNTSGIKIEI